MKPRINWPNSKGIQNYPKVYRLPSHKKSQEVYYRRQKKSNEIRTEVNDPISIWTVVRQRALPSFAPFLSGSPFSQTHTTKHSKCFLKGFFTPALSMYDASLGLRKPLVVKKANGGEL